jgi:hypothetical protein
MKVSEIDEEHAPSTFGTRHNFTNRELTYTAAALGSLDKRQDDAARRAANIKDRRFLGRFLVRLRCMLGCIPATKRGPVSVYDDTVMSAALEVCSRHAIINQQDLVQLLIDDGVLEPPVKVQDFFKLFKSWLKAHGYRVKMTRRGMVYEMTEKKAVQRAAFCQQWSAALSSGAVELRDILFMDVTTLLKHPHPKSEWCRACSMSRA